MAADGVPGAGFARDPGCRQGARLTRTALRCAAVVGACLALTVLGAAPALGADPQSYKVRLEGSVAKNIENTLSASSDLVTLRKSATVSPVGLMLRARDDTVRLKLVLDSYGYYESAVTATINGEPLTSADLADKLAALPAKQDAIVVVSFTPGPQYRLGKITLEGDLPDAMREQLTLHTGQPAISAEILAAGTRLLRALQDQGYAFAKVDGPVAYLLPDSREVEVTFHVQTGAVMRFGAISVTGLQRTRLPAVLSRLGFHSGDRYSATVLDRARNNLLAMGVFGTVTVPPATVANADGTVSVTFRVTERKRHMVEPRAGYSSDLGGSGGITWTDRNLFGSGEQLVLSASIINLNGSATNGVGYDAGAKLILPEFMHPAQSLQISLDALKQDLIAYDQTSETAGITLSRNLSKVWSASIGFTTTQETIIQPEEGEIFDDGTVTVTGKTTFYYTLFAVPLSLRYDSTDLSSPLLDPTHGIRAALTVTPTLSLGPPNATYLITQIRASTYVDMDALFGTSPGRTVIALRGLSGYAQGASVIDLPPDQRFYAGGSGTIRGYRFQSVGPTFFDGTAQGGVAVDAGSVELRQRVGTNWGYAVFVDGGSVGQTARPFSGRFQFGVGSGARYYTPIGALRVDFALPVNPPPPSADGDKPDRFEIYIGLGQSF
jgi:translocation and assembly module TamA